MQLQTRPGCLASGRALQQSNSMHATSAAAWLKVFNARRLELSARDHDPPILAVAMCKIMFIVVLICIIRNIRLCRKYNLTRAALSSAYTTSSMEAKSAWTPFVDRTFVDAVSQQSNEVRSLLANL
jgi:hypothetical protein